ncbi:MAG: hypothetical protein O9284_10255 [Steroidobacteraceae bacterium]|jgi:hypothetical protein|nr:hypothetical protein [Steroidobacteraceae bacterium]
MLYVFPAQTFAMATLDYERPYEDPIAASAGELLRPDFSQTTDYLGWTWCADPRGRSGWTPTAWCEPVGEAIWRLQRDFSALELTVRKGDRVALLYGESGFVYCEATDARRGWLPDAVLVLEP